VEADSRGGRARRPPRAGRSAEREPRARSPAPRASAAPTSIRMRARARRRQVAGGSKTHIPVPRGSPPIALHIPVTFAFSGTMPVPARGNTSDETLYPYN